jgi:hypothetical protein
MKFKNESAHMLEDLTGRKSSRKPKSKYCPPTYFFLFYSFTVFELLVKICPNSEKLSIYKMYI